MTNDNTRNRTKVVHLSSVHNALDTRIFYKEARTLADAGYPVVLIAQHERDEVRGGVRIRALQRPQNRFERMVSTTFQLLFLALAEKGDVYHFHDPELIPVGLVLRLFGKRVIYDVHEDVPKQVMAKEWIPAPLRRFVAGIVAAVERLGGLVFSRIVTATPAIARRFPSRKTVVIQNFPILGELAPVGATPYEARPPWVVYVGGITKVRGIREMVEALSLLSEDCRVRLRLAGTFSPPALLEETKKGAGWKYVDYLGWQDRAEVAELLANSRLGLVILHNTPNHLESYPVKLFEYMSAGIPVIASDFPLWRQIIEESGCGLLVDPLDPEAIAGAIRYLLAHPVEAEEMGQRGLRSILERYNWDVEARKLLTLYEKVAH